MLAYLFAMHALQMSGESLEPFIRVRCERPLSSLFSTDCSRDRSPKSRRDGVGEEDEMAGTKKSACGWLKTSGLADGFRGHVIEDDMNTPVQ